MKSKLLSLIALVAGLGMAGSALAGDAGKSDLADDRQAFKDLDQNSDGYVTPDEARYTWVSVAFSDVDRNSDGAISEVEYIEYDEAAQANPQSVSSNL